MPFHSLGFLVFFFIVTPLYFALPQRHRWLGLLAGSYFFYLSSGGLAFLLLLLLTGANYAAGIQIGDHDFPRKRIVLVVCLILNFGCLTFFKYFEFFIRSAQNVFSSSLGLGNGAFHFVLPLGISFYLFKNVSYVLDVYRGTLPSERHAGRYALYVAFFPQLLAGPIERSTRFLPQAHQPHPFEPGRIAAGLRLMLWGFFQKLVIADNLAALVDSVYSHPADYQGPTLVLATILFAFQIYYDFSGYSDIAIGAARLLGYETTANFNRPYSSTSIADFWRRWHISLSTWFRDYLYIPLGGNRVPVGRRCLNLLFVFILCGLWHGANWTFVVWGGLHGFYLVFSTLTRGVRNGVARKTGLNRAPALHNVLNRVATFSLVCFAWMFFRAASVSDISYILSHLSTGWENIFSTEGLREVLNFGPSRFEWIVGISSLAVAEFFDSLPDRVSRRSVGVRWTAYYVLILAILLLGNFDSKQFIYFQF